MSTPCLLLIDPPQDGPWNMAVDESLLDRAAAGNQASLRFYQWREATLSLGYFQAHAERDAHPPSRQAPAVRRLSGGGALVHDRELTYSLCLPASHPLARDSAALYRIVHGTLIDLLASLGLSATLYADCTSPAAAEPKSPAPEPFLCFARRSCYDVVMLGRDGEFGSAKIVGSAQRRSRRAVLQHGSVLLAASPQAPELPGIEQLASRCLDPAELIEPWGEPLASQLNLHLESARSTADKCCETADLHREKYAGTAWTNRR